MKKTKIPKIIHYCWFGNNPLPTSALEYIKTWKYHMPDYDIIEWNESNFDLNSNPYVKEAYENKKWAFVTDYVRLYALKKYGGIYFDTDVEVLKNFDKFLNCDAFIGFENDSQLSTAIIGSKKDGKWISTILNNYNNRHFILKNGDFDYTTNVVVITNITKSMFEFKENNINQFFKDLSIYSKDYFSPKDALTCKLELTNNSFCIHHFSATWIKHSAKVKLKIYRFINKVFGNKLSKFIYKIYRKFNKTPNE